jgi:hypothetical protein
VAATTESATKLGLPQATNPKEEHRFGNDTYQETTDSKNAAPERLRQRPGAFHCNERTLPFISDLEDVARVSVSTKVAATIDGSLLENNLKETSSLN